MTYRKGEIIMKNIIAGTFCDRGNVLRTVYNGVGSHEELIYKDIPCALSRSAHTHSPTPVDGESQTNSKNYRLRLYVHPEITFMLGDRVEVSHNGRVFVGFASDSFYYDSHSVCVVEVMEVREK